MAGFTGGCLCGQVRYEVTSEPLRTVNCHCDDCRRVTGSAFVTNVFVNGDDLKIVQGTGSQFEHTANSGKARMKEFCGNCGSQLFSYGPSRPDMKAVKVGSIDDASFVKPTANLFTSRALNCTHIDAALTNYDEMPTD